MNWNDKDLVEPLLGSHSANCQPAQLAVRTLKLRLCSSVPRVSCLAVIAQANVAWYARLMVAASPIRRHVPALPLQRHLPLSSMSEACARMRTKPRHIFSRYGYPPCHWGTASNTAPSLSTFNSGGRCRIAF
jgi:hypothetical protein